MIFKYLYIIRLVLSVLLPMMLAMAPAKAQTTVYQGTRTTLHANHVPGDSYKWELYSDPNVNFALIPGNCQITSARFTGSNTGASVEVEWLLPGIYFYKVTAQDESQCTNNLKIGMIKVLSPEIEALIAGADFAGYCRQVNLDASGSKGAINNYEWSVLDPGGAITNETTTNTTFMLSPSFTGNLPAEFRVRLRITDKDGNSDSDTISINVNPPPIAEIYSTGQPEKDGSMIVDGSVSTGIGLNYRWSTLEGKIVSPIDTPSAFLIGAGIYTLEVTDAYGCKATNTFRFPLEQYRLFANPDYARTSWAKDTTLFVLNNDQSTAPIIPGSVRVITPPSLGTVKVNPDGSVTYIPSERIPGRDQFIYEVCDAVNLCDSAMVTIDINDDILELPEAFSPNGDGSNDYLVFKNLENYTNSRLHIYTRSGQLVFRSDNYDNHWDGKYNMGSATPQLVPTGVYYYVLEPGGTVQAIKGFIYVGY